MNVREKIMKLIKEDKEIASCLFLFYSIPEDVTLWTGEDGDNFDFSNVEWLFVTEQENLNLVGINVKDNSVWTIDNEGDFHKDCDCLQNLPYEIIRIECRYTDNELIQEYFEKFDNCDFKAILARYENWCKENDIELDKNRIYHDSNGSLFEKHFKLSTL